MKCRNCEHLNLKGATFCGVCGVALEAERGSRESVIEVLEDSVQHADFSSGRLAFVYGPPKISEEETWDMDDAALCYAGVWRRFFATWLDNIILGCSGTAFLFYTPFGKTILTLLNRWGDISMLQPSVLQASLLAFAIVFAYGTFLTGKYGGTPGQRILGMKTLSVSFSTLTKLGYVKAFFRTAVYQVLNMTPVVNFFTALVSIITVKFSAKRQAIHDMICGTVVVIR